MMQSYIYWYLIVMNIISGIIFAYDKWAANHNHRRIPERNLHLFELLGGVFAILLLMYSLRHKNRKFGYSSFTWLIIIGYGMIFYFYKY